MLRKGVLQNTECSLWSTALISPGFPTLPPICLKGTIPVPGSQGWRKHSIDLGGDRSGGSRLSPWLLTTAFRWGNLSVPQSPCISGPHVCHSGRSIAGRLVPAILPFHFFMVSSALSAPTSKNHHSFPLLFADFYTSQAAVKCLPSPSPSSSLITLLHLPLPVSYSVCQPSLPEVIFEIATQLLFIQGH